MATINYTVNAIDAASGVFKRIAASADSLHDQINRLRERVTVPVDLNDAKLTLGLINAAKRIDKLSAMVAEPGADLNAEKLQTEVLRINAMLDRLGKKKTTVEVDVKTDTKGFLAGFTGVIPALLKGGQKGAAGKAGLGAFTGAIQGAFSGLAPLLGGGGATGIGAIISSLGALTAAAPIAAAAVGAALAAISFAAQAVAGVITFGLGAALAGMAILGASKAKSVKESFADLSATVNKSLTDIGKPFVPVLNTILKDAQALVRAMTPVFTAAAKTMAGPFQQFATILEKSFAQPAVKTSIEAVAKAFAALLTALTPQIPRDVQAIANAITNIANAVAKNPKAFADFVQFLVDVVKWGLNALGWLTQVAVYIEKHFIPAMSNLSGSITAFGKSSKIFTAFGFTAKAGLAGSAAAADGLARVLGLFAKAAQATMKLSGDAFTTFAGVAVSETKTVVGFFRNDVPAAFDAARKFFETWALRLEIVFAGWAKNILHYAQDAFGWLPGWLPGVSGIKAGLAAAQKDLANFVSSTQNQLHNLTSKQYPIDFHINLPAGVKTAVGAGKLQAVSRATGGGVAAGQWAMVGERGPEMAYFAGGGHVIPNHAIHGYAEGSGAVTVHLSTPSLKAMGQVLSSAVAAVVAAVRASASVPVRLTNPPGGGPGGHIVTHGQYGLGGLEALWQQAGGPGGYIAHIAGAIALAESGGNPNARNPSGASGLWQILGQVVPGNIFSPFVNALNAVKKFDDAGPGFSPWVTYTTGAYRQFLDRGGWLMPGTTVAVNNTGRPERVLGPNEGQRVVLEVRAGNSSAYSKFLVDELQKYVRIAGGGDVQVALGG